jgi:hypothetical protein
MKRLILPILFFAVLSLCAFLPISDYELSVKEVDGEILSFQNQVMTREPYITYCLYLGNEKTKELDDVPSLANFSLIHPIEKFNNLDAAKRWYISYSTGDPNRPGFLVPLLETENWSRTPKLLKHILMAFGPDDNDLILISYNVFSQSVSVRYHPRFEKDKAYYEGKLQILQTYWNSHNLEDDISLDDMMLR